MVSITRFWHPAPNWDTGCTRTPLCLHRSEPDVWSGFFPVSVHEISKQRSVLICSNQPECAAYVPSVCVRATHCVSQVPGRSCLVHGRRALSEKSYWPAYSPSSTCLDCNHTSETQNHQTALPMMRTQASGLSMCGDNIVSSMCDCRPLFKIYIFCVNVCSSRAWSDAESEVSRMVV